jgi:hypothetical protein
MLRVAWRTHLSTGDVFLAREHWLALRGAC